MLSKTVVLDLLKKWKCCFAAFVKKNVMGHTLNESLPLHVKQTWSHFLPRIRSQHVLDFLHKEGCLDRLGDHFACAPGKSRAMVVSIKRTSASIRYSIQFFLLSKCTSLVQVVLSAEKKKALIWGTVFAATFVVAFLGSEDDTSLFSPAAEPSHDFMVHNLRRGVACSNHQDFIPRYWIRRYMLHVPYGSI